MSEVMDIQPGTLASPVPFHRKAQMAHLAATWNPWGSRSGSEHDNEAKERIALVDAYDGDEDEGTSPILTGDEDFYTSCLSPCDFRPEDAAACLPTDHNRPPLSESETNHIIRTLFAEHRKTLLELTPQRLKCAWRIVRTIASLIGWVGEDELLLAISTENWRSRTTTSMPIPWGLRGAFEKYNLGLLPPRIPSEFKEGSRVLPGYNPLEDPALVAYTQVVRTIAKKLNIEDGAIHDPLYGLSGLQGLLSPWTIRLAFPTRADIWTFEEALVEHGMKTYIRKGTMPLMTKLHADHGLTSPERQRVLAMVKAYASRQVQSDAETDRAVHVLRLEDILRRSRDNLDKRVELGALKQLAVVQGIARADVENSARDFFTVVREKGGGELAPLAESVMKLLPPPGQVRRVDPEGEDD